MWPLAPRRKPAAACRTCQLTARQVCRVLSHPARNVAPRSARETSGSMPPLPTHSATSLWRAISSRKKCGPSLREGNRRPHAAAEFYPTATYPPRTFIATRTYIVIIINIELCVYSLRWPISLRLQLSPRNGRPSSIRHLEHRRFSRMIEPCLLWIRLPHTVPQAFP